jgi:hypothetical protein
VSQREILSTLHDQVELLAHEPAQVPLASPKGIRYTVKLPKQGFKPLKPR